MEGPFLALPQQKIPNLAVRGGLHGVTVPGFPKQISAAHGYVSRVRAWAAVGTRARRECYTDHYSYSVAAHE